jgi:MtN3 and saliva related transmembrane protein
MVLLFAILATFTSTISLVPQIYKTYKTKSASDLSTWMLINFVICSISWVVYGYLINSKTVLFTNILMSIFSFILAYFKWRYKDEKIT